MIFLLVVSLLQCALVKPSQTQLSCELSQAKSFDFIIMRMLNPSHFVVRILRYRTPDGATIHVDRNQKLLDELLANVLDELPAPLSEPPMIGTVYGMLNRDGTRLMRVQIISQINDDFLHVNGFIWFN